MPGPRAALRRAPLALVHADDGHPGALDPLYNRRVVAIHRGARTRTRTRDTYRRQATGLGAGLEGPERR